jgi:stearoyl-CoA desaturase (delta-9 desaturase)
MIGWARVKKIAPTPRLAEVRQIIDVAMLQAVVTYRYDVLAKYLKHLHQVAGEEFVHLRIDTREGRVIKTLLGKEMEMLPIAQQKRLAAFLDKSDRLARVYEMRKDLEALWTRSMASHEQLAKQLENWIARAEQSGIQQMEEFSLRLRSYAV